MRRVRSETAEAIEWLREEGFNVPTVRVVCPCCDGRGNYVNPTIDGNGITAEEMDELGDDFRADYMAGVYNVPCSECHGNNVVEEMDRKRATPEVVAAFDEYLSDAADYRATVAAEMRVGA